MSQQKKKQGIPENLLHISLFRTPTQKTPAYVKPAAYAAPAPAPNYVNKPTYPTPVITPSYGKKPAYPVYGTKPIVSTESPTEVSNTDFAAQAEISESLLLKKHQLQQMSMLKTPVA